ncbi:MAG: DUF4276 family protein, partial [Aureispira sp.]
MVNITVYVEGGTSEIGVNASTVAMSTALRESFYKLFSSNFDNNLTIPFNLIVEMGGGEIDATELFLRAIKEGKNAVLLIDVYKSKTKKDKIDYLTQTLDKLRQSPKYKYRGIDLEEIEDHQNSVFFMVKEMEAWFLSQLEAIENCAKQQGWVRKDVEGELKNDDGINGKIIQEIDCPSRTLDTLIQRNYRRKLNPKKKQKYGKLKHAPTMIEHLNLPQLKQDF